MKRDHQQNLIESLVYHKNVGWNLRVKLCKMGARKNEKRVKIQRWKLKEKRKGWIWKIGRISSETAAICCGWTFTFWMQTNNNCSATFCSGTKVSLKSRKNHARNISEFQNSVISTYQYKKINISYACLKAIIWGRNCVKN